MNLLIQQYGNQGYPLVFFHGWGFNHQIWIDLIPCFYDQYTIYLVDLPGFGQTNLMDWQDFKRLLLLRLPEEFAVLGWSMGGLYAIRLALEERRRVSHLMVVASSPYLIQEDNWPGIERTAFMTFASSLQASRINTMTEFIALQVGNHAFPIDSNSLGLEMGLDTLMTWDFRRELIDYCKPTYFVFGRLDAIVPFSTLAVMQSHYPQFEYHMIKKAAHAPFLSHQAEFAQMIREFL